MSMFSIGYIMKAILAHHLAKRLILYFYVISNHGMDMFVDYGHRVINMKVVL